MDAWRYGIYLLVFTFDISLEDKFHISTRPCIILYLTIGTSWMQHPIPINKNDLQKQQKQT